MLNAIDHLRPAWSRSSVRVGFLVLAMAVIPSRVSAGEYLSAGEVGATVTASLGILYLGNSARKVDSSKTSLIASVCSWEPSSWLQTRPQATGATRTLRRQQLPLR